MAAHWLDNTEVGFNTPVPLAAKAQQDWQEEDVDHFAITPGANW